MEGSILWLLIFVMVAIAIVSLRQVRPHEAGLIFRLRSGFSRATRPGWVLMTPFLERMMKVDLRGDEETVMQRIFGTWPLSEESSQRPETQRVIAEVRLLKSEYDRRRPTQQPDDEIPHSGVHL